MRLITFRGGHVVTPGGVQRRDVIAVGGVIAAITGPGLGPTIDAVVDCDGLLVMPGMVDTHVHLMDPGPTEREDFPTGTSAAAARGVTTILEHTHAHPIRSAADLAEKRSHLRVRANVDYGLAAHMWPDRVDAIGALWRAGVAFFKIFTCTTHGVPGLDSALLSAALHGIADAGAHAVIHCEDESITSEAERAMQAAERNDPGVIIEWRNREAEEVAVAMAATLVRHTGARATVAHVSTPAVLDIIVNAQRAGADIAAEACPQYLVLEEAEIHEAGPLRKFTPPARIRSDAEREGMWEAVRAGSFSHFSTDHAPSTLAQKVEGDIWAAPFGLPGLDTTYPFLIDAALRGLVDLPSVALLAAAAPARRYGLSPRKGAITPGADADLLLVDPTATWTVTKNDLISKAGWSPYEGRDFQGRAVATYLRGAEIARDGKCHDLRTGSFLPGAGAS